MTGGTTKTNIFAIAFVLVGASVLAGCATNEPGDGLQMTMGTMMPLTGALDTLGPDMQKGAHMAIDEINAANAGLQITAHDEDDGTTDTSGITSKFNGLVSQGATAIAGPCCSGVTASILDLAKQSKVVVSSPSATSPSLTLERENDGYFWRIAPSDAVQGKVLANLVAEDGHKTVNMIIVNNAYGNGLAKVFTDTFTTGLNGVVVKTERYEESATTFSSQVDSVCAAPLPNAVVLVAYIDDGAAILKEMQAKDCLSQVDVYGSEGVYSATGELATKAGKDAEGNFLAAGMKGTTPESGDLTEFNNRFNTKYGHMPELYTAESYDAVMYVALAALKAGSVKGEDIKAELLNVANAPGTKCSTFAECAQLINDGQDIDYKGAAHDFEYDANHEPKTGVYSWWQITPEGTVELIAQGKSA